MKISKIKKKIKNYIFLCIGACHNDNILKLKNKHKFFRTNPLYSESRPGGVSANIATNLILRIVNMLGIFIFIYLSLL